MNSEISNVIDMNERDLEKFSKAELIKMLLKQEEKKKQINKPVQKPSTDKSQKVPKPIAKS